MDIKNIWDQAFQQFDEESFFEKLENKVKAQPYYTKYKSFKDLVNSFSYIFAIISMLTASYAVYWLCEWMSGHHYASIAVAIIFLIALEKIKRKSSSEFWQVYFFRKTIATGWLSLSLLILAISMAASAFGTRSGIQEQAPDPELIANDSIAQKYRAEVASYAKENKELSTQRNHEGIIYHRIQKTINTNKAIIADYQKRILALDQKLEGKNELLSNEYRNQLDMTTTLLMLIVVLMELFYEACIAFIWYYYYRSYIERKLTTPQENKAQKQTYLTPKEDIFPPIIENQKTGFQYKAEEIRNNAKQPSETTRNNSPKQPETTHTETTKQLVPQATQRETTHTETTRNNSPKQRETIKETIIVSTPNEDVSKLRKYAQTYYNRSVKKTSETRTRENNRKKYLEYRELLELTGKYNFIETPEKLIITEIG